jgi:uncharacterized protein YukE
MPRRHNKEIRKANRIKKRSIKMNQNRNNNEDGTAPPVAAGTAPPVAAVTTACRIMAHEHNDPLKNAYASNEQTRILLAEWNAERKVAIEFRDQLNESKVMITKLEGKIDESAGQNNELKKKNEKFKQGIKRKLASSFKTVQSEMNEKIEKVQSELIEQIEKDVEEETGAGNVEDTVL